MKSISILLTIQKQKIFVFVVVAFHFWKQEDDDGLEDDNGKYFVSYAVSITINGKYIDEEDLYELFPNFEY